jgi:hypothetical protein
MKPSKVITCVTNSLKIVVLKISEFDKNTFPKIYSDIKLMYPALFLRLLLREHRGEGDTDNNEDTAIF